VKHIQRTDPHDPMGECCILFDLRIVDREDSTEQASAEESRLLRKYMSDCYPIMFHDRPLMDLKFAEMFQELERREVGYRLRVQALVISIMVDMLRIIIEYSTRSSFQSWRGSEELRRVNRIVEFVNKRYMEPIQIEDITQFLFLCPKQINRLMKKLLHCSFHEYLLNRRIESVKQLLAASSYSVEEIATRSGFSSHHYMYQVLRRHGLPTPGKLRQLGQ
jgi:YesN/AraC family two-component response regulator